MMTQGSHGYVIAVKLNNLIVVESHECNSCEMLVYSCDDLRSSYDKVHYGLCKRKHMTCAEMLKRYTSFSVFRSRSASTTSISSMISLESTVSFGQVSIPRIFIVARFPVQHIRRFVERERERERDRLPYICHLPSNLDRLSQLFEHRVTVREVAGSVPRPNQHSARVFK